MQLVDVYRARIVDVSPESLVIETTGTEDKIDSLLEVLRPYGVDRNGAHRTRRDGARHAAGRRRARRRARRRGAIDRARMSATVRCRTLGSRSRSSGPLNVLERRFTERWRTPWRRCITTTTPILSLIRDARSASSATDRRATRTRST
jgi:hypothetical protein